MVGGELTPYGGELAADLDDAAPEGAVDLFLSRQQLGEERYEHLIDITLARFDSDAAAAAFAADPDVIAFPPTWEFGPEYAAADDLAGGGVIERVQVDDDSLRASGYRTVRQEGELVQVVQWLAGGNALVSREAIAWLTDLQSACLAALPEPCAPVDQDEFPAALRGGDAPEPLGPQDGATPETGALDPNMIQSDQFGWRVALPDDGWEVTDTERFTNADYHQLQSGRSLVTIESVVDQHGDPQQCVLDNLALREMLEERAVIDLGSDDPAERPAGIEPGHGWAVYTVEPLQPVRADQEYTIRYDCYTLAPGGSSLVVTHTAPRDLWAEERDKGERFRDGIQLPGTSATTRIYPLAGDGRFVWRTRTMGIPRIWIPRAA